MTNHIIIDGHNYIFQTGGSHARECRETLLLKLVEYRRRRNIDLTVVFDNRTQDIIGSEESSYRGVNVIYAALNEEADQLINKIVENEKNKKRLIVVTTDNAHIGGYCKRMGAKIISPFEFKGLLEKRAANAEKSSQTDDDGKPTTVTKAEMEYYLKKFQK